MLKQNFFLIFLISFSSILGQEKRYSDEYLDSIIGQEIFYKKNFRKKSLQDIAQIIRIDEDKTLQYAVLAKWIINHLNYDKNSKHSSIKNSMNLKKGVCHHYSVFMDSLAKYLHFNSYYIVGYAKIIKNNKLSLESHAWNAVKIDGKILMSDITWCDGNSSRKSINASMDWTYFLMEPERFILTHFPVDKKYRFSKYSFRKFKNDPIISDGYYAIDNHFSIDLHKIKLYNKQSDLKLSFKPLTDSIEIEKIELIKWNKNGDSDYSINFNKKINPKKKEIIYYLNASDVSIEKGKNVSIVAKVKKNDVNGENKKSMIIMDFFW